MSRTELVSAYVDGSVSRRTFIRRLVAAGVSLGAAVSYAHLLAPERASAQIPGPDFYTPPEPRVTVTSKSVEAVAEKGKIKVIVAVEEPSTIALVATVKAEGKEKVVSTATVDFAAAGEQLVKMKLNGAGKKLLSGAEKAKVTVYANAVDRQNASADSSDIQKLK